MKENYLPKEQRKKILLISDDVRFPSSGIGHIAKEIILNTCHKYNWVQIGSLINHPEYGKRIDLSEDTNKLAEIEDASVIVYPSSGGYGNPHMLREIMKIEKPDGILIITDPRFYLWLFQMENEVRKEVPIMYLNIWDNYPAPHYNRAYYESCDALFAISKQTENINKLVLGDKAKNKLIKYVPHGVDHNVFKPLESNDPLLQETKKKLFKHRDYDFIFFFNSRNMRRKNIPDMMAAYRKFTDSLSPEKADRCLMLMHTEVIQDAGTDLLVVRELFENEYTHYEFSTDRLLPEEMNCLYNIADCTVLLSNAEGWGLSITESVLAGTPVIATVTGGIQEQLGLNCDFDEDFISNSNSNRDISGEWAFPVYPAARTIAGSPLTPYIYEDVININEASFAMYRAYHSKENLPEFGNKGREYFIEKGFTAEAMSRRLSNGIDQLLSEWTPREEFEFLLCEKVKNKLNHKI